MANERGQSLRCAVYTRKSSDEGLEQSFNSLDAQREACEAYILSQRHEGWAALATRYDDGGYSGGSMQRPALQALMQDIEDGKIDLIVVYKVDRLTRSLSDFAKMVELFDSKKVSFVSVTQQFNTTTSMGRLTLNVLLSFAQFEREVTGERIRDKIAASKKKGMWMGGHVPVGYDAVGRKLVINPTEAEHVIHIYQRYLQLGSVAALKADLDARQIVSKVRTSRTGKTSGGLPYSRGALYELLQNRLYIGDTVHRDKHFPGEHEAIISKELWDQVQEKMQANTQGQRSGARAKEPSLLVGLVFDEMDRRLTPSHTVKGGKRYRYYVVPPSAKGSSKHGQSAGNAHNKSKLRIPAQDLENIVTGRINAFLTNEQQLLDACKQEQFDATQQRTLLQMAQQHAAHWNKLSPAIQRDFLHGAIERITVKEKEIVVHIKQHALIQALLPQEDRVKRSSKERTTEIDQRIVLTVQAQLARCGLEVRLVIAGEERKTEATRPNQALIKAIARGRHWYEQLTSRGKVSLTDLAIASGVNDTYTSRVLRLAFLAPDIVEAILEGHQPKGLTLSKMLDNLSLDWNEQRQIIGLKGEFIRPIKQ
jgi:DNA invertase Pin-like site-specific DNA recombinase